MRDGQQSTKCTFISGCYECQNIFMWSLPLKSQKILMGRTVEIVDALCPAQKHAESNFHLQISPFWFDFPWSGRERMPTFLQWEMGGSGLISRAYAIVVWQKGNDVNKLIFTLSRLNLELLSNPSVFVYCINTSFWVGHVI